MNDRRPLTRLGRLAELLGRAGRLVDCPVCAGGGSVPGSSRSAEIASAMRSWLDRGGPVPELPADPVPCHACGGWGVLAPDKAERLRVERESVRGRLAAQLDALAAEMADELADELTAGRATPD